MQTNVPSITWEKFRRLNETTDPEFLEIDEAAKLENMILDKVIGKPYKRGGFAVLNSNNLESSVMSMYDAVEGSNSYILAAIGTHLYSSLSATGAWSSVKSGLTSGKKMRIVGYNGRYYCTNGYDTPFVITSIGTPVTVNLAITKPDVSSVTTNSTTGGELVPNAKYIYCLVYVSDANEFSSPSVYFTKYMSATDDVSTDSTNLTINIYNLPVSTDPRITSRLLFRTKADGKSFYLLERLDNETDFYTDTHNDTDLDTSQSIEFISVPTKAFYSATHKERLFLGNLTMPTLVLDPLHASDEDSNTDYEFHGVGQEFDGGMDSSGTYLYKIIWIDKLGNVSNAISTSITLGATDDSVVLYHIPLSPVSGVEARIYRTINPSTGVYYFIGTATRSSYVDVRADSYITSNPTIPSATTATDTYKCGVIFSEIGKPAHMNIFDPNDPTSSFLLQIYPDDNDEITGIIDDQDGVIVFKQNSICVIQTNGNPGNWEVKKLYSGIGSDQPQSIVKVGSTIYFVNKNQVYRYPDSLQTPLSLQIANTMKTYTTIKDAVYYNNKQWYVLVVWDGSSSYGLLVYDEKLPTWYKFTSSEFALESIVEKNTGTLRGQLITGLIDNSFLNKYDETISLDYSEVGTYSEISCTLRTKTVTTNDPTVKARLRQLYSNYRKKQDLNVVHTLCETDTALTATSIDSTNATNSTDYKDVKIIIDQMTNAANVKQIKKLYYEISGTGLTAFGGGRLQYRPINRGTRG